MRIIKSSCLQNINVKNLEHVSIYLSIYLQIGLQEHHTLGVLPELTKNHLLGNFF